MWSPSFSTVRQLNGSNDQTDAYTALSSHQKILVRGFIHSSPSSNVDTLIGSMGEATKLDLPPASVATPQLSHLTALPGALPKCICIIFIWLTNVCHSHRFLFIQGMIKQSSSHQWMWGEECQGLQNNANGRKPRSLKNWLLLLKFWGFMTCQTRQTCNTRLA